MAFLVPRIPQNSLAHTSVTNLIVGIVVEPDPAIVEIAENIKYKILASLPGPRGFTEFFDQIPSTARPQDPAVELESFPPGVPFAGIMQGNLIDWQFVEREAGEECAESPEQLGSIVETNSLAARRSLPGRFIEATRVLFGVQS